MKLFQLFLTFCLLSTVYACQESEPLEPIIEESTFDRVDPLLQPYFEEFETQAAARGFSVDLQAEGIIGKIEELTEEHVAGQCTYGASIDNEVTIDQGFWNDYPQYYLREMVIFHELGHCYLNLDHREGAHANGTCLSIMRSGLEDCRDNYHAQTRDNYLDELFSNL